jgi:hypothetical protein
MNPDDYRRNTVSGLRDLADFLYYDDTAPLNPFGHFDLDYHILEPDDGKARAEFEDRAEALEEYAGGSDYFRTDREHRGTVQHIAAVHFGNDMVRYRVVWIESLPETGK